jgi:hypothetical protein
VETCLFLAAVNNFLMLARGTGKWSGLWASIQRDCSTSLCLVKVVWLEREKTTRITAEGFVVSYLAILPCVLISDDLIRQIFNHTQPRRSICPAGVYTIWAFPLSCPIPFRNCPEAI